MKQKFVRGLGMVSVVGLIGLLITACGGSSSADPLKKPEFVREANAICKEAEAQRTEALKSATDDDPSATELSRKALSSAQEMVEELNDLGPPIGDEKEVRAIIAAFDAGAKEVEANPADFSSAVTAFAEANELARRYGLTDCTI